MNKRLRHLIGLLKEAGLNNEANELKSLLIKYSFQDNKNLQLWQGVLYELEAPRPLQIQGKALQWLFSANEELKDVSKELQGADEKEIKDALKIVEQVSKNTNLSVEELEKLSSMKWDKELVKTAQWGWLKGIGSGVLKSLPLVGVIFSFLLVCKNVYYSFVEYNKLVSEASQIGLSWADTLQPSKMNSKIKEYYNNPEKMRLAVRTTRTARTFVDEGVSLIANTVDFIKDIIMLFAAIPSLGLSIAIDVGISILIFIVELAVEEGYKSLYNPALQNARERAESMISVLVSKIDHADAEKSYEAAWSELIS